MLLRLNESKTVKWVAVAIPYGVTDYLGWFVDRCAQMVDVIAFNWN